MLDGTLVVIQMGTILIQASNAPDPWKIATAAVSLLGLAGTILVWFFKQGAWKSKVEEKISAISNKQTEQGTALDAKMDKTYCAGEMKQIKHELGEMRKEHRDSTNQMFHLLNRLVDKKSGE